MAPSGEITFEEARAQFPVLERLAYLNAGTFGPIARATYEAICTELERDYRDGRSGGPNFVRVMELRQQLRERIAALVGAEPLHVALTTSTTDGCNIVLGGLGLGPEDEIVTTTDEHFGLLGGLATSGARIVVASPDPDAIRAAVTSRTRLLALSQVIWTTGRILPVRELRAETGIPVLVDGAQSVGAIPVAAAGLDYLTISGQKWLCGPDATGALVVADPDALRVTMPSYFSQAEYEADGRFQPKPGAARFDPGWWPASSLAGLLAALDTRPAWAFDHAARAAERCRKLLAERVEVVSPAEHERSTLVAFRPGGDPSEIVESLHHADVHVREIPGTGLIRVSCGWWTSDGDLDRLLAGLPEVTRRGSCPCGAVSFTIDGPVRDVIVCHCTACQEATGGPWPAAAAYRRDLTIADETALVWDRTAPSEHDASRGNCRACQTAVFWDAPGRDTVSVAATLIDGGGQLEVAAHIWVPEEERAALATAGLPIEPQGLPASVSVRWHTT